MIALVLDAFGDRLTRNRMVTLAGPCRQVGRDGDTRALAFQEVDSPAGIGTRQVAALSTRPGGLDAMYAHGRLSDAQNSAHLRFRTLYEAAHADGVAAIDYSRVRVDGGGGSYGTPDRVFRARDQLKAIRNVVGDEHFRVLELMSGQDMSLEAARQRLPANDNRQLKKKDTVSKLAKAALDRLDAFWNCPRR